MDVSYQKVPWSYSQDGKIRSGDSVMITNGYTKGFLCIDIGDRVKGVDEKYMATTTRFEVGPMKRSVLVLRKYDRANPVICYGDKINIEINPHIFKKPLFLSSQPYSLNVYSTVSR